MSVNLLPTNLKPSPGVSKLIRYTKNATSLLLVTFFGMLFVFGGIYMFNLMNMRKIDSSTTELVARIKSFENTEQSLYLLRDRIEKINQINSNSDMEESLDDAILLSSFVSEDITIEYLDITSSTIKFGVSTDTSNKISKFLTDLQLSNLFDSIQMESLNYNQNLGFVADFTIQN